MQSSYTQSMCARSLHDPHASPPKGLGMSQPKHHRAKARGHHSLVASFTFSPMQISVEGEICLVLSADLSSFHSPFIFQLACFHNCPPQASSPMLCGLASLSCVSKVCHRICRCLARCIGLKTLKTLLTRQHSSTGTIG